METLPNELIIHVLAFLSVFDVLSIQATCQRLHELGRDNNSWKHRCFEDSLAESSRRRQQLLAQQDDRLVQLRKAFGQSARNLGQRMVDAAKEIHDLNEGVQTARSRALTNWDPSYAAERVNFYQEYIQRHAPIWLDWFREEDQNREGTLPEAVGAAILNEHESNDQRLLVPLEDGSICIYDLGSSSLTHSCKTRLLHQTRRGHLFHTGSTTRPPSPQSSNETEATDNLSIDHNQRKAYIATLDHLSEVDLNTLQVIRRQAYPFPITALSAARYPCPLTVGTHNTLHLYDPRTNTTQASIGNNSSTTRCELIAGHNISNTASNYPYSRAQATLSQPGPLAIIHEPLQTDSIWVAGRFTSLLHYDRRFWPRISNTLFSGARLSSLSVIPYPYLPHSIDLLRNPDVQMSERTAAKSVLGSTLIAAGEYKGKGSLELYNLSDAATSSSETCYRNRQTASKSRLLSVTPHGTRIVFSDGDGNLKWTERDGTSIVRTFNINADGAAAAHATSLANAQNHQTQGTLFADVDGNSDIVRKIIPRVLGQRHAATLSSSRTHDLTHDDLVLWTGDGRLGVLGFGRQSQGAGDALHAAADDAAEDAHHRQERQYRMFMRNALERQADETRFVRGLGLGYGFGG